MTQVRVGDIVEIRNGYAFDSKLFNSEGRGLPIARIRDVVRGVSETYTTEDCPSAYLIGDGDLLIGMDGEFGIEFWRGGRAVLNQRVCRVRGRSGIADDFFLKYRLAILLNEIEANTPFVTVKHLSSERLKREAIGLPPLPEQKRIAAILTKADRLRRLRRYARDLSDTYLQSVFLEMFGDPVSNPMGWALALVGKVCNLVRGSSPRPQGDPRYFGGPVPRLMIADITRDGMFVTPTTDSLTEEGAKKSRPMKAGSVVMAVSGATGLPAILNVDACIHDGFVGFRKLDKRLLPIFLAYLLATLRTVSQSQATGAIWQNLTTDQTKTWQVPCPPLSLQQRFANIVHELQRLRAQQRETERQAEHLFQTLLHQAFRGEL